MRSQPLKQTQGLPVCEIMKLPAAEKCDKIIYRSLAVTKFSVG